MKELHPEIKFHLMLSDEIPGWLELKDEPFDSIIQIKDLGIENWESWMFKHDVVEMCTAVKPFAFLKIMNTYNPSSVFYFDPDVVIFSRFDQMIADLKKHSAILTPHVCSPETLESAVVDNEISCLKHGINNLGFLAANSHGQGRALIEWWAARLHKFCYDDIPRGLFTDQRWMDFAHVFFKDVKIDKGPEYNVATWNYTTRKISGNMQDGVLVDNRPLCFHHFSGFTNGAAQMMQGKYADGLKVIEELYNWYRKECSTAGQSELGNNRWEYAYYSNGSPIERSHRLLYRDNIDLQTAFPNPRACSEESSSTKTYFDWLQSNPEKLYSTNSSIGFWEFMTSTEQSLYGFIERAKKPNNIIKKSAKLIVKSCFFVGRKLLKLFT